MVSVKITSLTQGQKVIGRTLVTVEVTGGTSIGEVSVVIGQPATGTRIAGRVTAGVYSYQWDTTRRLSDPSRTAATDSVYWVTATAVVDGNEYYAPYVQVTTANTAVGRTPNKTTNSVPAETVGGWRPELAWAANYSGTLADWTKSQFAVIGGKYATLVNDPVLGSKRKVIKASVPNSAAKDKDQPTPTTVRFQSSSRRNIVEGDEFCVGFSFMPSADFPTVYPRKDPTNPRGNFPSYYIALFQFYGPPYVQGSPLVLQANRGALQDPADEFVIRGNELNPGDPVTEYLSLPYKRGQWTDVVFRIHASASIDRGWIETYVNQGESTSVRALKFAGQVRTPRVLLRSDSEPFRTDMQIYRVKDRFDRVTVFHTGHKITQTVAEADPGSYRNGTSTGNSNYKVTTR